MHHSFIPRREAISIMDHTTSKRSTFLNPSSNINNNNNGNGLVPLDMTMQLQPTTTTTTSSSSDSAEGGCDAKWASKLLRECAAAMSAKDSSRIHHLLWMLNELASPYGDCDQKLASYFLQALFCKATDSGRRCYKTLISVAERSHSFDSLRRLILKFQEVSPWTTFGHVASNGAMLEALDGEPNLHVIDLSNTLCTQWPTLLEAVATRADDTPRLRLTAVVTAAAAKSVMKEVSPRMEKFARLMGVPFEFTVVPGLDRLGELTKESLGVRDDEAVAVNCVGALRRADVEERKSVIEMIKSLRPKIVTVVEEEADFSTSRDDFVKSFEECLRFYMIYFDMLEESFAATSNEKLMLERECSRSIVRVLACDGKVDEEEGGDRERREKGRQWSERLREAGFTAVAHSDDVVDDVRALLKRYKAGWSLVDNDQDRDQDEDQSAGAGIYLGWKDEAVVWASVWKP